MCFHPPKGGDINDLCRLFGQSRSTGRDLWQTVAHREGIVPEEMSCAYRWRCPFEQTNPSPQQKTFKEQHAALRWNDMLPAWVLEQEERASLTWKLKGAIETREGTL